ncbi:hypothetical protein B0H14DRAFT_3455098 [Mycena olivaceomarginata]|nr:hypothetical protein B0H14DRAFT_3455098 [Mycena olivaceomarginata]
MERRPHISPIFIPPHFTSNLASPSTFGTPDNGYQSSFTPASTSGLQFQYNNIPASPLEKRRNPPPYPADLPDLQDVSDDEDDSEDEEEPIPHAHGWEREPAQWRYNMDEHLAQAHPEYTSPRNPNGVQRLPHAVWESMKMAAGEEIALGILLGKIPAPFARVAEPDEGVNEPQQSGVRRVPSSDGTCGHETGDQAPEE